MSICSELELPNSKDLTVDGAPVDIAPTTLAKEDELNKLFGHLGSVIVAYSGGVDSSYVAYIASEVLGSRARFIERLES